MYLIYSWHCLVCDCQEQVFWWQGLLSSFLLWDKKSQITLLVGDLVRYKLCDHERSSAAVIRFLLLLIKSEWKHGRIILPTLLLKANKLLPLSFTLVVLNIIFCHFLFSSLSPLCRGGRWRGNSVFGFCRCGSH